MIRAGHDCKLPYTCYSIDTMKEYGKVSPIDETCFRFIPAKDMAIKMLDSLCLDKMQHQAPQI
jgi:hypothetical protein